MQIQPFQASYPDMGLVSSADHFFGTVKERFNDYVESGYYQMLEEKALFVCTIERPERTHTGLVACVDMKDYFAGHIKRHEKTLAASEQEQIQQLLNKSAHVKPVMLTYQTVDEIEDILLGYAAQHEHFITAVFETNGETHRFWKINDPALIGRLQKLFSEHVGSTYIADGHHRMSSNAIMFRRLGVDNPDNPFRWLPCSLFPTDEVEIYDFNRIVEGMNDFSPASFMARLSGLFEIEVLEYAQKPTRKHELTMYLEREWYRLTWRPEILDSHKDDTVILDVSLLNEKVLVDILGIQDVRTDLRMKYVSGAKTLGALRERTLKGEERFAFCLYPITISDFLAVSDANEVLPPKSTWFEPRVRSGLLVQRFDKPEI